MSVPPPRKAGVSGERNNSKMKADEYGESYLWNREMDKLLRVLQRMEALAIWPKRQLKTYEVRLKEICTALNADFGEAMMARERADQWRFRRERIAREE